MVGRVILADVVLSAVMGSPGVEKRKSAVTYHPERAIVKGKERVDLRNPFSSPMALSEGLMAPGGEVNERNNIKQKIYLIVTISVFYVLTYAG